MAPFIKMPVYVIYFVHRHLDFRLPELDAVLSLNGVTDASLCYDASTVSAESPFLFITLASDEIAQQVAARCVLVKGIYKYITHAEGDSNLYQTLRDNIAQLSPEARAAAELQADSTWSLQVDCFGQRLSLDEQNARRHELTDAIPLLGDIQLKLPARTYWILEEKGVVTGGGPSILHVKRLFFAKSIAIIRVQARDFVGKHKLKKRKFIGPTTMDHELSLVMANLAKVGPGTVVCDPFVGTASVLVACAQFGANCIGGDIEMQGLFRKDSATIAMNFEQYDLPCPDFVQWDLSQRVLVPRPFWDAIVCDPPYGQRAGARKCSAMGKKGKALEAYAPSSVLVDLLHWAATRLVRDGRLVYVLACKTDPNGAYDDQLPTHPCLRVLHVCAQSITQKLVRLFITMVKTKDMNVEDMAVPSTLDVGW
ncbi:tRNA guanosine-2'-O-methyltransferase [Achlya hypogyna]|uniref:tRNA guanosine-2'-O-methyltransferase n=1 Tax=Achlya hypogyna TaxID=1202772 RepID=A0A1V9Z7W6_ACHHY|nr:tRNA guanosine-2'-O-methyltransferase [Achlya hypogyna]